MALASEPPSFLVHALLGEEIVTHVHGLSRDAPAPG